MASLYDETSSRSIRQKTCVDNWVKNKCIGTIVAATGFGFKITVTVKKVYFISACKIKLL